MIEMYVGKNNSPETILSNDISATATIIPLASIAGLPPAPNLCTIGEGDDAEVVRYNSISGQSLTGCERGFGGTTAKLWIKGEVVARCYTEYDHEAFIANIRELQADVKRYGVKFTGSVSKGVRLYDAAGLNAAVGTDEEDAENDFDTIMPWAGMRRCNTAIIGGERVPTYFEGEVGYSNTEADVFVYVPRFYYWRSEDDSEHVVSMSPLKGYRVPSKFKRADGTLRDYVFLAAYTLGMNGDVPVSRSGYYAHGTSLNAFMNTICKGQHTAETLDSDIWIEGMKDDEIKCILLDIEFATRDHQTVMYGAANMRYAADVATGGGTNQVMLDAANAVKYVVGQTIAIGTTDKGSEVMARGTVTEINAETGVILFEPDGEDVTVSVGNYVSSRPWKSGACDSVKSSSGSPVSNTSGVYPCVWRGMENPWGNAFHWRWDFLKNDDQGYVLDAPENYSASIGAHHTALSYKTAHSNGYATKMGFDENFPFARVTEEVGGGSTTYFADYFYYASGVRALLVGGDVNDTRFAGARYCYVYYAPSHSGWNYCAALSPA